MPESRIQIIGAATVAVVRNRNGALFTGPMELLYESVSNDWPGKYSFEYWEGVVEFLIECGVAKRSKHPKVSEFIRVSNTFDAIFTKVSKYKNPPLEIPYVYEYQLYGDEWLKRVWNAEFQDSEGGEFNGVFVPSADGLVTLNHNQAEVGEALYAISKLSTALSLGNDIGDLSSLGLSVARTEVTRIADDLTSPALRLDGFKKRAKDTLTWIAAQSAGAIVGTLALAALAALAALFGIST